MHVCTSARVRECMCADLRDYMYVPKSSPFCSVLVTPSPLLPRRVTKAMETGLLMKWKKRWWPRHSFCARGTVTIGKAVKLDDVQGAYYALSILCIVSCLALLAEFARGRPAV